MVSQVLKFIGKEVKGLHEAAYLLGIFALASQFLALIRDRIFASYFGAGDILDVYYTAFRIPDALFVIISALVSVSVLVPFLVSFLEKDKQKMQEFINTMFSLVIIVAFVSIGLAFFFARDILQVFVPELLNGDKGNELVMLTRVLLLQPFLLALSSLFGSMAQAYKKFYMYALSPLLYNIGIIAGVIFFYPKWGLVGLGFGVLIGALLHALIQIPAITAHHTFPRFSLRMKYEYVSKVLRLSIPRTIALLGNQVSLLFLISIASVMTAGSIAVFNFSLNLQSVPMAIIGVSYSLAAFPTLSRLFADGDRKTFISHITKAARHIIFWSLPVMVMFIVLRAQIVRTILGSGEFSWEDTRLTAAALALFAISVLAQNLVLLFVRGYYSAGQTKRPLIIALVSVIITITLAFVLDDLFLINDGFRYFVESLMRVVGIPGTEILMLPLAYSIGQIVQAVLLWVTFDLQFKAFSDTLWKTFFHSFGASLIAGYVAFVGLKIFDNIFDLNTLFGIFAQGFLSGIMGIAAGVLVLYMMKNRELSIVWRTLHRKVWKTKLVAAEPEELG